METYAFRGAAGEVVRGFVRPSVLITLVPILLLTAATGLVAVVLAELVGNSAFVLLALGLIVSSALVGRFALAAREGDLEAGFVSGRFDGRALAGFVLRYLLLTLCWSLPVVGVGALFGSRLGPVLANGGVGALVTAGPAAVVVLVLGVVVLLAPTLAFIVATYTDSPGEVLSLGPWRWLLVERRLDLVPFYVTLLGGSLLFAALVGTILLVATVLSASVSTGLAATVFGFAWVAPTAGAPILLGRLCGAFVAAEGGLRDPDEGMRQRVLASRGITPTAVAALAGASLPVRPVPTVGVVDEVPAAVPPAAEAQRRMQSKAETDLAEAIVDGERYLVAHPANPGIAAELAALYRRAGREDDMHRTAALAIERGLRSGSGTFAIEIFARFADARASFDLGTAALQQLGWLLLQRGELEHAGWCFDTAAVRGGDAKIEKGLVAVAEALAAAGDVQGATARFEAFLAQHPASMLMGQARSALTRLVRGQGVRSHGEAG